MLLRLPNFNMGESDVSSSRIRRLLKVGKIKEANLLLSYNYRLSGK